jgi:hypothetical protein
MTRCEGTHARRVLLCRALCGRSLALPGGKPTSGERWLPREEGARWGARGSPASSKLDPGGATADARGLDRLLPDMRACRAVLRRPRVGAPDRVPPVFDSPRRAMSVLRRASPLGLPGRVRGVRGAAPPERPVRRPDQTAGAVGGGTAVSETDFCQGENRDACVPVRPQAVICASTLSLRRTHAEPCGVSHPPTAKSVRVVLTASGV